METVYTKCLEWSLAYSNYAGCTMLVVVTGMPMWWPHPSSKCWHFKEPPSVLKCSRTDWEVQKSCHESYPSSQSWSSDPQKTRWTGRVYPASILLFWCSSYLDFPAQSRYVRLGWPHPWLQELVCVAIQSIESFWTVIGSRRKHMTQPNQSAYPIPWIDRPRNRHVTQNFSGRVEPSSLFAKQ